MQQSQPTRCKSEGTTAVTGRRRKILHFQSAFLRRSGSGLGSATFQVSAWSGNRSTAMWIPLIRSRPRPDVNVVQMAKLRVAGANSGPACGHGYSGFGPSLESAGQAAGGETNVEMSGMWRRADLPWVRSERASTLCGVRYELARSGWVTLAESDLARRKQARLRHWNDALFVLRGRTVPRLETRLTLAREQP